PRRDVKGVEHRQIVQQPGDDEKGVSIFESDPRCRLRCVEEAEVHDPAEDVEHTRSNITCGPHCRNQHGEALLVTAEDEEMPAQTKAKKKHSPDSTTQQEGTPPASNQ